MTTWTIQKLLNWTTSHFTDKGLDSPRLSAELILAHTLKITRIELYTNFDKPVQKPQLDKLHDLVKRAAAHEPISYLTGQTQFYSLQIETSPAALIPRPETELLVDAALDFLKTRQPPHLICDLCTGSACIPTAIATNAPTAKIIATDICPQALKLAAKNIENHHLTDQVKLLQGDLFTPIANQSPPQKFDLITSNPPYVTTAEYQSLDKNIKDYEPKLALIAGPDGLDVYRKIAETVHNFLNPTAALIMEIGQNQADPITELLKKNNCFTDIKIKKDHQNNDRVIIAKK